MAVSTTNRPPEGWATRPLDGALTWTSHDPFARPPHRDGFTAWWIARHGSWVTYVYKVQP